MPIPFSTTFGTLPTPFVEVHHIIPEAEGGQNTLENAAPLCAGCHAIYGGNPIFRQQIRGMRDNWYDVCERRFGPISPDVFEQINHLSETLKSEKEDRRKYQATFNEIKKLLIDILNTTGNAINKAQNLPEIQNTLTSDMVHITTTVPQIDTLFGKISYPGLVVGVRLKTGKYQSFEFILDSGADCTVVPRSLAALVGIQLPAIPDSYIADMSGRSIPCYKGELKMKLQDEHFEVRCLFTDTDKTPFILGRADFFSLFSVHFDSENSRIILEKIKASP